MTAGEAAAQRILAEVARLGITDPYLGAQRARQRVAGDVVKAVLAGDVTTARDLAHVHELLVATEEAARQNRDDGEHPVTTAAAVTTSPAVTTAPSGPVVTGDAVPDGVTPPVTRACAHCGRPFTPKTPTQDYCSQSHRNLAYRARKREREASPPDDLEGPA